METATKELTNKHFIIRVDGTVSEQVPIPREMAYNGTLREVLGRLESDAPTTNELRFGAPLVIRAAIDEKILHPSEDTVMIVDDAIKLALLIYQRSSETRGAIKHFRELIERHHPKLLDAPLEQKEDSITWRAMQEEDSLKTARRLVENGQDAMFIALAHGGVAAGMDVFLHYCNMTNRNNSSKFYVVRFSNRKLGDRQPQLTEYEIKALRTKAEGKRIIIFDEDTSTGCTIAKARDYFEGIFMCNVEVTTNICVAQLLPPASCKKSTMITTNLANGLYNRESEGREECGKYEDLLKRLKHKPTNRVKINDDKSLKKISK